MEAGTGAQVRLPVLIDDLAYGLCHRPHLHDDPTRFELTCRSCEDARWALHEVRNAALEDMAVWCDEQVRRFRAEEAACDIVPQYSNATLYTGLKQGSRLAATHARSLKENADD